MVDYSGPRGDCPFAECLIDEKDAEIVTLKSRLEEAEGHLKFLADLEAQTAHCGTSTQAEIIALRQRLAEAVVAIHNLLIMRNTSKPTKLDEALTWREIDDDRYDEYVVVRKEWLEDVLWWVEQVREDYEDAATGPPLKKEIDGYDPTTLMWPQYYKELKAVLEDQS